MTERLPIEDQIAQGRKFNRLTPLHIVRREAVTLADGSPGKSKVYVEFLCDCGNTYTTVWSVVQQGSTQSCGCWRRERVSVQQTTHGHTRGGRKSPEWSTWSTMIQRCTDPASTSYPNYGAKGIRVCDRWLDSFGNFLADMGPKPDPHYSIERKDSAEGYTPENCIWADIITQANNRSTNVHVEWEGQTYTVAQLARHLGREDSIRDFQRRLRKGWSIDRTVNQPIKRLPRSKS